ncbi:MAG: TonB-dependent receptor [Cytophagales bacterium]|nr:TonB-dependent receptor [Cytophagales bacterium]
MKKKYYLKTCLMISGFLIPLSLLFGQSQVSGSVTDSATGEVLIGVTIKIQGTSQGTTTDVSGNYSLSANSDAILEFSYIGYKTQEVAVGGQTSINISLEEDLQGLSEIVIVGGRFRPRSVLSSPVPVDNISAAELESTGQLSLDQMINFKVQSYNATQQTVSDATAHFNPADLRGLGPSRTLVLINGKRKNASALVYINDTPGKGEVGVDMQSIPIEAIERVEVLRDGASAQYGSDAIAGVINVILKENIDETNVNFYSGITSEGDGFNYGFTANTGFGIFDDGFVNVSTGFKEQERTDRGGEPGDDVLILGGTNAWTEANPDLGMTVGQPDMTTFDVFYNAGIPVNNAEVYSFGGVTYRNGKSFALYRAPYWVDDPNFIFHESGETYEGFQPTFETDIYDRTFSLGIKGEVNGWDVDLSSTTGSNSVEYNIGNSLNEIMGVESPTRFHAGGYEFSNIVNNLDLFRKFDDISLGFGSEYRTENFITTAGEEASYIGEGTQSFPGLRPSNEVNKTRYNVGFYSDIEYDNGMFLIGGTARFEKYGDFGDTFNWKLNSRVMLMDDRLTLRTSASTGFRAPSLHQIYLSNIQTLISGGTVSNQATFNNHSPAIRELKVPNLKEEESFNFTAGLAINLMENLDVTFDYYNISVNDRVLFTSSLAAGSDAAINAILATYNVTSIKFFTNAVDTETKGVDFVVSYDNLEMGSGKLGFNLAANYNKTSIEGKIKTPTDLDNAGYDIFDRKEQSRIVSARPKTKVLVGIFYEMGKFNTILSGTHFGKVRWKHANNGLNGAPLGPGGSALPTNDKDYDQVFSAKLITDLSLAYKLSDQATLGITINNLLDVYPDEIETQGDFVTDLGGRFKYPWEVNQFGFMGRIISGKLNFKF